MRRHGISTEPGQQEGQDGDDRREALHVLVEARERLLQQMAEDILSHRELLLQSPGRGGYSSFELEEIEDRYSARLNAINSLLENLEYRHPQVRHRIETLTTTSRNLKRDLTALLAQCEQWDLVDLSVTPLSPQELLVVAALAADEYPE